MTILGGFFALTVGTVALRGLASLEGHQHSAGFTDLRDALSQTIAITLGLVLGSMPAALAGARSWRPAAGSRAG